MIVCLPIKSSDFIWKIRLCYYDTGHTIIVQNPNNPQENWEVPVFLMKVEFHLHCAEKRMSAKALVSSKVAKMRNPNAYRDTNDDDSSQSEDDHDID